MLPNRKPVPKLTMMARTSTAQFTAPETLTTLPSSQRLSCFPSQRGDDRELAINTGSCTTREFNAADMWASSERGRETESDIDRRRRGGHVA